MINYYSIPFSTKIFYEKIFYLVFQPFCRYDLSKSGNIGSWKSRIMPEEKGKKLKAIYLLKQDSAVSLYISYEWSRNLNTNFTLGNFLFGALKFNKIADPDKYGYSGCGIGFDPRSQFLWLDGGWRKNVVIFGADMGSFVCVDNKYKDILVLCDGPTQGLDDTTITAEVK